METVYLDNSATTRPYDSVIQKMQEILSERWGNPSSLHRMGIEAQEELEIARGHVAKALGASESEIFFTSGGTESNNLALLGAAYAHARRGNKIISTACEHSSVDAALERLAQQGFEVVTLNTPGGVLDLSALEQEIDDRTIAVSVMFVNNETGAVFPSAKIKDIILKKKSPALLHCDAVQAFCRIPFTPDKLGADLVSVSSHKIHGPKGAGALYIKKGVRILPILYGGGHEKGLRSGTEAVSAVAGFGEAAKISFERLEENICHIKALKKRLLDSLSDALPWAVVNSPPDGAPHIINLSLPGFRSEVLLHHLESLGIYISAGSACSSHNKKPSRVLEAMGLPPELIKSAIRVSLSHTNTEADIDRLINGLLDCEQKLIKG